MRSSHSMIPAEPASTPPADSIVDVDRRAIKTLSNPRQVWGIPVGRKATERDGLGPSIGRQLGKVCCIAPVRAGPKNPSHACWRRHLGHDLHLDVPESDHGPHA